VTNFNQGHNGPFALKQPIPGAEVELCDKQYHLLHKLYGGAAPWWSSWSGAEKMGAKQSQTPPKNGPNKAPAS